MVFFRLAVIISLGYLLGSIPWGLIFSRLVARVDIRHYGSGRTGGTNVLRTMGGRIFILVALLDLGKGALAVVAAPLLMNGATITAGSWELGGPFAQALAGLAVICGHIWPLYAGFRGGRGVATFFGALITLVPAAGLLGGETVLLAAVLSGFASLGSILGVSVATLSLIPLTLVYGIPIEYLFFSAAGALLIIIVHRDNIRRLLAGNERRFDMRIDLKQQ